MVHLLSAIMLDYTTLYYSILYTIPFLNTYTYDAILHCTVLNYVLIYYTRKSHVKFCIDVSYILSYYVLLPFINVSVPSVAFVVV